MPWHARFFWIELALLIFFAYFLSLLSSVEYFYHAEGRWVTSESLSFTLIYRSFEFVLLAVFYWGLLKPNIMGRRPLIVFFTVLLFVPCAHLYRKYVSTNSMRKMVFLSQETRSNAERLYSENRNFDFLYIYHVSMDLFPLVGFAYLLRALRQDEQLRAMKEQQLISELNYLRAQLQPHFFFNTLNNIYGLALDGSRETAPVVAKLAEMMRYMLYRAQRPLVPLGEEVSFLRSYVDVERIRHHGKAQIGMEVQGRLDSTLVAPLILLPFVENAFKHGVNRAIGVSFVEIVLLATAEELHFQVKNSKSLMPVLAGGKEGIGLENVKKRLTLLYPDHHKLDVLDKKDIFQVNLTLSWKV